MTELSKKLMRERALSCRRGLNEPHAGKRLAQQLEKLSREIQCLFYASMADEAPTREAFELLNAKKIECYFARTDGSQMNFYRVQSWAEISFESRIPQAPKSSVWQASKPTLALVPGLVFNRNGDRIGFGKGFYDRFLERHPELFRVGWAFDSQIILESWPVEPHDQRMDFVCTPSARWGSPRLSIQQML